MKLFLAALGFLFLAAWLIEAWGRSRSRRRWLQDRHREHQNLRHITGTQPWWKDPPPSGDDLGDH